MEGQRRVVELEFFQRRTEEFKVFCFDWVDTSEDHGFYFFKTFDSLVTRIFNGGDGITHFNFCRSFNTADNVAYVAARKLLLGRKFHLEHTHFVRLILLASIDKDDVFTTFDRTIYDFEVGDDATIGVKD